MPPSLMSFPHFAMSALMTAPNCVGVLPTGQVVGVIDELPTVAEVIARIVDEAEQTLARLHERRT